MMTGFRDRNLEPYLDRVIGMTAVFQRTDVIAKYVQKGHRLVRTALVVNAVGECDGNTIDIGHVWVQEADEIYRAARAESLHSGDRFRSKVRVGQYWDRSEGRHRFNVGYPDQVEVIQRREIVVANESEEKCEPEEGLEPNAQGVTVKTILAIKGLAQQVGGWEALVELIQALRS
jgi:hypothetical protein